MNGYLLKRAVYELAELRKDAEVFVQMYKMLIGRIREQEHAERENPLHVMPECHAAAGCLELGVRSLQVRINQYQQSIDRLQQETEDAEGEPTDTNDQSAFLHLVWDADRDGPGRDP